MATKDQTSLKIQSLTKNNRLVNKKKRKQSRYHKVWSNKNRAHLKNYHRSWRLRLRDEFIKAYGSKCSCCGESEKKFLTLGHLSYDKDDRRGGLLGRLKRRGWPKDKYILLCFNCNCSTQNGNKCVHTGKRTRRLGYTERSHEWYENIKKSVIDAYGGKCSCCGIVEISLLTLDHTKENGKQIKKKLGLVGWGYYRYLYKENFPKSHMIKVMCYNCNCGRSDNNGVCPHEKRINVSGPVN